MKARIVLRVISLVMFVVGVIFVICALMTPTMGMVFYIGDLEIGVEIWHAFYIFYAVVTVFLFILSFLVKMKR